jgi:hypothetical protein
MMEHWNTGLNKTILGFSCIIPELSFQILAILAFLWHLDFEI